MKPTREQCMKWAKETCTQITWGGPHLPVEDFLFLPDDIEALCQRVWNEAIEASLRAANDTYATDYVYEEIRNLKVTL